MNRMMFCVQQKSSVGGRRRSGEEKEDKGSQKVGNTLLLAGWKTEGGPGCVIFL